MKKLVLTAALVLSLVMGSYTQGYAQKAKKGGVFGRGATPEQQMRGEDEGFFLPTHGINGNWDADQEPGPAVPLGSGALLLMGFGAAYAMKKRNKRD